jgi:predicted nucleic acid-binding protein
VLAWLLAEPDGESVWTLLVGAEEIVASDLTLIECDRTLIRAQAEARVPAARLADARAQLAETATRWSLLRIDPDVVERARHPFPREPVRTLDALHLASLLVARAAIRELTLLSLDRRVREAGRELGIPVVPD